MFFTERLVSARNVLGGELLGADTTTRFKRILHGHMNIQGVKRYVPSTHRLD